MSSLLLFADNASSTLAAAVANTDTTCTVAATTGAIFSNPGAGQYALGTFEDVNGNIEIVQITARLGDSFTIVRGQEGTTPLAFASGTRFEQRVTAGMLAVFLQKTGSDVLSGTTILSGVLNLGSGGSIQNGEIAGAAIRSAPGVTANQILVPVGNPATAAGSVILTAANVNSNLGAGVALIQSGMIVIWSGISSDVPSGFFICDGTNGTPDLRDKFVLGAGGTQPSSGGSLTTDTGTLVLSSLSTDAHALTITEMPSHGHDFWCHAPADYSGSGTFTGYENDAASGPAYTTQVNGHNIINTAGGSSSSGGAVGPGVGHTHTISGLPSGAHTHQAVPPYQALCYIMKS
jgi:hypothetical protein